MWTIIAKRQGLVGSRLLMLLLLLLGLSSPVGAVVLQGPTSAAMLPGGVTVTQYIPADDNQMGITGGKTVTYSNVALADNGIVYWGPHAQGFMLSLDGCDYLLPGEMMTFNPTLSNLPGGVAVWSGATQIYNAQFFYYQPLPNTTFTLTVTDEVGDPLPLTDATTLGLDANVGAVLAVTGGMTFNTNSIFKVESGQPAYEFYNIYPTAGNNACTSMYTGFYYNEPPTVSAIGDTITQLNTVFGPYDFNVSDDATAAETLAVTVASSDPAVIPEENITLGGSGNIRTLTITPLDDINGTSLITVTVTDEDGLTTSDSFSLMVNRPPRLTKNVQLEVNRGESGTITSDFLAATDVESLPADLTYTVGPSGEGGAPHAGGTLLNAGTPLGTGDTFTQEDIDNGLVSYSHDDSCSLFDDFQFDVTDPHGGSAVAITGYTAYNFGFKILMPNRPPVAVDDSIPVPLGNTFNGNLAATDPDCDPQVLTFRIVTNGTRGSAVLLDAQAGTFAYTPAPGESGVDSFTFQVNDGITDALLVGTVSVSIENQPPVGQDVASHTRENFAVDGTLTATDLDLPAQSLNYRIGSNGTLGSATITDPLTGAFTYTPNPDAFGLDTFTYIVNDGLIDSSPATVTVSISPNWDSGDLLISNGNSVVLYDPVTEGQAVVATGGFLTEVHGLALEATGTILVVDKQNGLVRINSVSGEQTQLVSGFAFPIDVAVEANGNILVSSGPMGPGLQGVFRYNPSGGLLDTFAGGNISFSTGLAIAADGTIYVGDAGVMAGSSNKIVSLNPVTGEQAVISGSGILGLPIGIDLDGSGNLYVADAGPIAGPLPSQVVKVVLIDGTQSLVTTAGSLAAPADVIVQSDGSLLTANIMGGALVQVDPATGVQGVLTSGGSAWSVKTLPDVDDDMDGINFNDNCPLAANANQIDSDNDGIGNACDADDDNDGIPDVSDAFPLDGTESLDTDNDGIGNNADSDDDNDGVLDINDALPLNPDESVDTDSDGIGNNADLDDDNDGILDADELIAGTDPLNPDITLPVLIVSTLSDLAHTKNGSLNVSGTVTDNEAIASLVVNGDTLTVQPDNSFSTVIGLLDGENIITVTARDLAGNQAQDSRTIILDQNAPQITISTPADNSITAQAASTISGTVDETAEVSIVDQEGIAHVPTRDGNAFSADLILVEGLNTLTVTALDLAENTGEAKRTVTYDPSAPSLSVTDPSEDIIDRDGLVTISGQVSDTISPVTLTVTANGVIYTPPVDDAGLFSQEITLPEEGTYPIQVTATDAADNQTSVTRNILYTHGLISINQGAEVTSSPTVKLSLDYQPAATKMRLCFNNKSWTAWALYATTKTVLLPAGAGIKTVYVQFLGVDGTESAIYFDSIRLDTLPPKGSLSINNGDAYTDSLDVTLTLVLAEAAEDVQMQFSTDNIHWSEWEAFNPSKSLSFTGAEGNKTAYVRFMDSAGKISTVVSDSIKYKVSSPAAGSAGAISINSAADFTRSLKAILTVTNPDPGYTQMQFSTDSVKWSAWFGVKSTLSYALPAGDGIKTIYVRFKGAIGTSTLYSDSIILDTKGPMGTISLNNGAVVTATPTLDLTLQAADLNGVSEMQFSENGTLWSNLEAYQTSRTYKFPDTTLDGNKKLYVRFKDSVGNLSVAVSDTIKLDRLAPIGTVFINANSVTITKLTVPLTLKASGAITMQLSLDGGNNWGKWEPYVTKKVVTLPSGDGIKTVMARFRDLAGNVSGAASDSTTITTAAEPATLAVPVSDLDGKYPVSWEKVAISGFTYTLEEATNADFTTGKRVAYSGSANTITITSRSKGKTYFYRVKTNKSGWASSDWTIGNNSCTVGR